jgi:hypothetical protein
MKLNFNEDKKSVKAELVSSDFEGLLKAQKKAIPEVQESIQEVFKDYAGTMVAIVVIKEDENGDPEGRAEFIGGVGTLKTQLALYKALDSAKDSVTSAVAKGMASNPDAGMETITDLVEQLRSALKKGKI